MRPEQLWEVRVIYNCTVIVFSASRKSLQRALSQHPKFVTCGVTQVINHPRRACPHIAHARCKSRDTGCPCPLNANARLSKLWRIQRPTSFLALARPWWVHYHIPSSFFSTNLEDQEKRYPITTDLADGTLSMTSATSNPDTDLTILIWLSQHCTFSLFEYSF